MPVAGHGVAAMNPDQIVKDIRDLLGSKEHSPKFICSVYLYGSAIWGWYRPGSSDVDLVVIIENTSDRMTALQEVRRFHARISKRYRIDISTNFECEASELVPCRPYILNSAADHGVLVFGEPTLPTGMKLAKTELLLAIKFHIRQFSRNYVGFEDCWESIIRALTKAAFLQLSQ